jgi:thioredoxin reductase (NADPH)
MTHYEIAILGSGAAGLTAAIYAGRGGYTPLVISGHSLGGQLTIAGEVENYPGFSEAIDGSDLMQTMQDQAQKFGTEIVYDQIVSIDFSAPPIVLNSESGSYSCDALIVATGATAQWLGIPGESEYMGKGVSACATCDGFFFKGLDAVVVGGGNTAVEEALYLSRICKTVHVIHRRDSLRAERILQDRSMRQPNVVFHWNSVVTEIIGKKEQDSVGSIQLNNVLTNEESSVPTDCVFVAIGHKPATSLFKDKLDMNSNGYILVTPGKTSTNLSGVFAAGDVADPHYRQAVTAAGMGCMAAIDAMNWLESR